MAPHSYTSKENFAGTSASVIHEMTNVMHQWEYHVKAKRGQRIPFRAHAGLIQTIIVWVKIPRELLDNLIGDPISFPSSHGSLRNFPLRVWETSRT